MAVAPASMADQIVVLDDGDEEETSKPSCSPSTSSSQHQAKHVLPLESQQPVLIHITKSPFASAKKDKHVLQAENNRLFSEFVEHCSAHSQDCPEVLTFLQAKHSKASPDYLSSVAFRNTLGSCLTRAQENRSKTYVYIYELCTVLKQHSAKRRQALVKVNHEPCTSVSSSFQSTSGTSKNKEEAEAVVDLENRTTAAAHDTQPSTSGLQGNRNDKEEQDLEKKKNRASRKQIAYLENLLKVYNDEIHRLQQSELSIDDMGSEESSYIQENKLKRKMMKIYDKLCELKGCSTLTGRVIEQRIPYSGTRYPEINRKIERFINSAEARRNPPDFQDILQQVIRANERHNLFLTRKQMNQFAKEAFGDVGTRLQERRHQDMVFNFGSHLTDSYKPASDPALQDPSLHRKLKSNREVALTHLEEVISKYSVQQEDSEQDRSSRQQRTSREKEGHKSEKEEENKKNVEEKEEEAEDDDDEDEDESSDPDIEEELQASAQQDGPDDENEEEDGNPQEDVASESVSALDNDDGQTPVTNGLSPLSCDLFSDVSPLPDVPSSSNSPGQSESALTAKENPLSNGSLAQLEEPEDPCKLVSPMLEDRSSFTSTPPLSLTTVTTTTNGTSTPTGSRMFRNQKRKREETECTIITDSKVDLTDSSPLKVESTRASTPIQDLTLHSPSTPPPKKNKVNVATQCDPEEIIVLSDSE
ncbi:death domain-associated protein 6 [Antennarius striatus]|uniref:death domain-associated protein 6 n=1 Tax=Antennarius striatus TaxID=241820 RepID=UPI0035AEFB79